MATIGTIKIGIIADPGKLNRGLGQAGRTVAGFGISAKGGFAGFAKAASLADRAAGALVSGVGRVGNAVAKVTKSGLLAGGLGVTAGLGLAARQAVRTEKTMAGLAKATDLSGNDLQKMKGDLQGLSVELKGVKLDDLYEIAIAGGKLGIAQGDLVQYTRGIAMLSTAIDDLPASEIADSIGKINSVFSLGTSGALQMGSAIDKLADAGNASASGILNVTQRISGTAAVAKIGADETVALAATLLDTGTGAELAATTLQRLTMALNSVEGKAGFARALGISTEQFAAKVKASPIKALQEWLAALKQMDAESQQKAIAAMGVDAIQSAGEIMKLSQAGDTLTKYLGMAGSEFATLNQIQQSYARTAETTDAGWTQAQNRLQILAETVGAALLPAVNTGLSLIGDLTTGFTDGFARLTELGQGWGIDFSGIVEGVGLVFRNLPDFVEIAAIKIGGFFTNIGEYGANAWKNLGLFADYLGNNWAKLCVDGISIVVHGFKNLATNLWELGKSVVAFLTDPTQGFKFNWTPLLEGFKATAAELPKQFAPELTDVQKLIDEKIGVIGQREAERQAKLATVGKGGVGSISLGNGPRAAAAKAAEAGPGRKFDSSGETKFVGAQTFGSAEAYSTLARFRAGGESEGIKSVAASAKTQVAQNNQQIEILKQIAMSIGEKVGSAMVPGFA